MKQGCSKLEMLLDAEATCTGHLAVLLLQIAHGSSRIELGATLEACKGSRVCCQGHIDEDDEMYRHSQDMKMLCAYDTCARHRWDASASFQTWWQELGLEGQDKESGGQRLGSREVLICQWDMQT